MRTSSTRGGATTTLLLLLCLLPPRGLVKLLGFNELSNGVLVKTYQLATTGNHLVVKLGDKIIDSYTGPAGLPLAEYMTRLSTSSTSQIFYEVVQTL